MENNPFVIVIHLLTRLKASSTSKSYRSKVINKRIESYLSVFIWQIISIDIVQWPFLENMTKKWWMKFLWELFHRQMYSMRVSIAAFFIEIDVDDWTHRLLEMFMSHKMINTLMNFTYALSNHLTNWTEFWLKISSSHVMFIWSTNVDTYDVLN